MATVYIVTAGEYSDYRIEAVFLNEEKAEKYCSIKNRKSNYTNYRIETYDTCDNDISFQNDRICYNDKTYQTDTYIDYEYVCGSREPKISVNNYTLDDEEREKSLCECFNCSCENHRFYGRRIFTGVLDDNVVNKYKKYCYDRMAYCKSLLLEGFSGREITAFLKKGYRGSDNE